MNGLLARAAPKLPVAGILAMVCACSVNTSGFGPGVGTDAGGFGLGPDDRTSEPDRVPGTGGAGAALGGSGGGLPLASGGQPGSAGSRELPGTGGATVPGTGGARSGTGGALAAGSGGSGASSSSGPGGPQPCGEATCPGGCCNGNNCVTANRTNRRCGTGGVACSACDSCFQCVAGTCQVDPQSSWTVRCASAIVAPTRAGAVWDPSEPGIRGVLRELGFGDGPLPDPFCQLRIDGSPQSQTSTQVDTLNPAWDESIDPSDGPLPASDLMSPATHYTVYVGDDDGQRLVEDICEVALLPTESDFRAGTMTFTNQQSCTRLTVDLTCN